MLNNYIPETNIFLASASKLVSLRLIKLNTKLPNNMWINAGGGYFKSSKSNILFYGTNIGYDRLFTMGNAEILIGSMAGFGQSRFNSASISSNSTFYNAGLYVDLDYKSNEFQSNINALYTINNKMAKVSLINTINTSYDSLNDSGISLLWSNYYKYRFNVGKSNNFTNYIKPVLVADVQTDIMGGYSGRTYKQQSSNNIGVDVGIGSEYSVVSDNTMYAISFIAKYNVYNSIDNILLSLSNANNFIGYKINKRPISFQPNFSGYVQLPYNISLQYGISGLADIEGGIGGKGGSCARLKGKGGDLAFSKE